MNIKRFSFIIITTLALLIIPGAALAQGGTVPQAVSGEVIPCPMPLAPGDVDGENVICGQIQVPENWDDPDGRLITITYARKLSSSLSPLADPIIFFHGGPGGSVLASQGSSSFDFSYLRATRDVIVWDQRGTRYSSDLLCPQDVKVMDLETLATLDLDRVNSFSLQDDPQEILDITTQLYVKGLGEENCPAYFAEQGVDVSQYNTDNTVLDAIALMEHLDYPVYNLFGISYGTTVSLAIMTYYENNPDADLLPIRSALIDGVAPLELVPGFESAIVGPRNVLRVFADCEADAACGAAYPNIRQGLIDLLASLESAPVTNADGLEVTLDSVVKILNTATSTRLELVPYLPRMVDELGRGETTTYQAVVAIILGEAPATPAAERAESTNPLDALTLQATALAEQLHLLANDVDNLGDTSRDLAETISAAETLAELYLGLLDRYLADAGPIPRSKYAETVLSDYMENPQQTRQGLLTLSNTIAEPVAGELRAIVNLLSDAEVAAVWASLTDETELVRLQAQDHITNAVVLCNAQRPTYKVQAGWESLRSFEAPQLILANKLLTIARYNASCELYDVGPQENTAADVGELDIVPTLVMNGGTDHATPVEWGEAAFATLGNARMITVPLTDHGVTRYSKCAKDIAHAFFLNPEMALVTSCVNQFAPVFVLPADALPQSAAQ